ncbi:MAG TPA: hypothetical protein DGG95_11990 [Cytophagales bacterium]|jgi:hypothetical protein|nr:hypothetical protein [Cytophagales bacterium]
MRYREIASKFSYYLGVIVGLDFCITVAIALELLLKKPDALALYIVLLILSPISLYIPYETVYKYIYASVDLKNKSLVFGNISFHQEVELKEVKILKKRLLRRNTYKVAIGNRTYYIMTSGADLKSLLTI